MFASYTFSYFKATKFSKSETYVACGCGCCGGTNPVEKCLYKRDGDNLNEIIKKDLLIKKNSACHVAGCSQGILYKYCD